MKKKIRHIIVIEQKYNWRVTSVDSNTVLLRTWIDGLKRLPWVEAKFPFKDPWLNFADLVKEHSGNDDTFEDYSFEGITPKKVSIIIETVVKDKGLTSDINRPISLNWCPRTLTPSYAS